MEAFLNRHAGAVIGVLSGFDRLMFRGTLRVLAHHLGMKAYLWAMQVVSIEHLAINPTPDRDRYAVPFFVAPNTDWPIRCLPTCCSADNPPRYPEVTYEQYRLWFLRNNYHAAADAQATMAKP